MDPSTDQRTDRELLQAMTGLWRHPSRTPFEHSFLRGVYAKHQRGHALTPKQRAFLIKTTGRLKAIPRPHDNRKALKESRRDSRR